MEDSNAKYDYYTFRTQVWEDIFQQNLFVWGPMLGLGVFAINGHLESQTAWWIENVISNFYMPAYVRALYKIFEVAYFEGGWRNWASLIAWSLISYFTFVVQIGTGTRAISYLRGSDYVDETLLPSLWYTFSWIEHPTSEAIEASAI